MRKAFGFIDAACMNNADAIAVLVFGSLVGNVMYPWCANHGIKIPTTYKFAIGSAFGAASIMWASRWSTPWSTSWVTATAYFELVILGAYGSLTWNITRLDL